MTGPISVDIPKPGERIRIHPACDWFMRGETYVTMCFARQHHAGSGFMVTRLRVQGERSGKRFWLSTDNVLEVVS